MQKNRNIPCCRRRRPLSSGQTSDLNAHRVSRVTDRTYAITEPKEHYASGRVEDPRSFAQNIYTLCKCFVQKNRNIPCCRRRRPLSSGQTCSLNTHRVSRVTDTIYAVGQVIKPPARSRRQSGSRRAGGTRPSTIRRSAGSSRAGLTAATSAHQPASSQARSRAVR